MMAITWRWFAPFDRFGPAHRSVDPPFVEAAYATRCHRQRARRQASRRTGRSRSRGLPIAYAELARPGLMDAAGAEDNHPRDAPILNLRAVVALRALDSRAQPTRHARCAPAHRAHRPCCFPEIFDFRNGSRTRGIIADRVIARPLMRTWDGGNVQRCGGDLGASPGRRSRVIASPMGPPGRKSACPAAASRSVEARCGAGTRSADRR